MDQAWSWECLGLGVGATDAYCELQESFCGDGVWDHETAAFANNVVGADEECDDGNNINGDGCDNNCTAGT